MDRRQIFGAMALATLATPASAQPKPSAQNSPTPGANASPRRIAEMFAATLNAHSIEAFGSLFAETYRNFQMSAAAPRPPAQRTDKQNTMAFFQARLAGIPDLRVAIEAIVADEEMVAASFAYSGHHQGSLMGMLPTGKLLRFTSCDIFAVRGGLIVEHWGMGDIAGLLAQLQS